MTNLTNSVLPCERASKRRLTPQKPLLLNEPRLVLDELILYPPMAPRGRVIRLVLERYPASAKLWSSHFEYFCDHPWLSSFASPYARTIVTENRASGEIEHHRSLLVVKSDFSLLWSDPKPGKARKALEAEATIFQQLHRCPNLQDACPNTLGPCPYLPSEVSMSLVDEIGSSILYLSPVG